MDIMKRILIFFGAVMMLLGSCQKLDLPELDSDKEINGLKCYVFNDPEDWGTSKEVDLLSGNYNAVRGAIIYTFSSADFTREDLQRCRLEASIPSTASIVELSGTGEEIGNGIGGLRSLYNTTVYFKVVAADGSSKSYQVSLRYE